MRSPGRLKLKQESLNSTSPSSPLPWTSLSSPFLPSKCSLGCPVLDSVVQGGITCGSITEIVGECASGKTQICLQLLVSVQIAPCNGGLGASSVYIFTESYFPSRRLQQIAKGFTGAGLGLHHGDPESKLGASGRHDKVSVHSKSGVGLNAPGEDAKASRAFDPCDNIFVQSIQTVEELWDYLEQLRVLLVCPPSMPIKLLIIDSIAALFRSDFDNNARDLARRMEWFFKLSSKLKQYAHQYDIAILVTNQVVDHVEQEEGKCSESHNSLNYMLSSSYGPMFSEGRRVVPALGIGWSHCVNTRLFLSRVREIVMDRSTSSILQCLESELPDDLLLSLSSDSMYENKKQQCSSTVIPSSMDFESHCTKTRVRRMLHVVFAPNLPARSCEFVVETTQVRGLKTSSFSN